jgi:hypothetical protein
MALLNSKINSAIDKYGEFVSIETFTTSTNTYNDYGDLIATVTTSYTNVPAVFNTYGESAIYQTEGQFMSGNNTFFFKGAQSGVEINNNIVRANGERWKVINVSKHYLSSSSIVQEARVSIGADI